MGQTTALSFITGATYLSTFNNLQIHGFTVSGITETKTDALSTISNCVFASNAIDVLLSNTQGIFIHDNVFGGGSVVHLKGIGGSTASIEVYDNNLSHRFVEQTNVLPHFHKWT